MPDLRGRLYFLQVPCDHGIDFVVCRERAGAVFKIFPYLVNIGKGDLVGHEEIVHAPVDPGTKQVKQISHNIIFER